MSTATKLTKAADVAGDVMTSAGTSGTWTPYREAAQLLKISTRQLSRYIHDGRIEAKTLPKQEGQFAPEIVVSDIDLARYVKQRKRGEPFGPRTAANAEEKRPEPKQLPAPASVEEEAEEKRRYTPAPKPPRLWCSPYEACRYTGIARWLLDQEIANGGIIARDFSRTGRHRWRVYRPSLEQWR